MKSKDNIADPLTKGLTREMVAKTSRGMGLRPLNKSSQRTPYLVDWRSQDLDSKGQLSYEDSVEYCQICFTHSRINTILICEG